jgi:hypothetical protein
MSQNKKKCDLNKKNGVHLKLFFSNFNLILGNFVRVELQEKEKKKKQKTSQKTASKASHNGLKKGQKKKK